MRDGDIRIFPSRCPRDSKCRRRRRRNSSSSSSSSGSDNNRSQCHHLNHSRRFHPSLRMPYRVGSPGVRCWVVRMRPTRRLLLGTEARSGPRPRPRRFINGPTAWHLLNRKSRPLPPSLPGVGCSRDCRNSNSLSLSLNLILNNDNRSIGSLNNDSIIQVNSR